MKYKRNRKGQFISNAQYEEEALHQFKVFAAFLIAPFLLGLLVHMTDTWRNRTVEYQAPHFVEVAHAYDGDMCGLKVLVCEDEKPVEDAVLSIPHNTEETERRIRYLYAQAEAAGLDGDALSHTIYCESMWYNVQSGVIKDGVQEPSYGLAQIHLPSHPTVTKAQALDPYFAIDWMIERWDDTAWYGYDRTTDTCNNSIAEYWL